LLIGEIDADETAQEQHASDEKNQHRRVLAEQPAAGGGALHRRIRSARKRTLCGTLSPKEAAVLRLTARTMFSALSTGRSCGRAPRRMFATSRAAWAPCSRSRAPYETSPPR